MGQAGVICHGCGKTISKAHAVDHGHAYCGTCYKREFKPRSCEYCGKGVRTLHGQSPAVCKTCRCKGRVCIRCGKPTPRAALTVEGGVVCASCAVYFKPPQPCPACGQMTLRLARSYKAGFTMPVCQRCRTKGYITCPVCRKYRRPAGIDGAGKTVCQRCLESEGNRFICPSCGQEGERYSAKRCQACYWNDTLKKRSAEMEGLLRSSWVREGFAAFAAELAERVGGKVAARRLQRYLLFFLKLDTAFSKPEAIDHTRLAREFGPEGLRRFAVPFGFLVKTGVIPAASSAVLEQAHELDRQERILAKEEEVWHFGLIERYHAHLLALSERYQRRGWVGEKARFRPRTVTQNLHAAAMFLRSLKETGVGAVQQIEQVHLDKFCLNHPGYRNGVRGFIRYLNAKEKIFRKLGVETVSRGLPEHIFLSADRCESLISQWTAAGDDMLKEALIGLMLLLYGQPIRRLVRLRLRDLQRGHDGCYRLIFGRTELRLHDVVGHLLDRYLVDRKTLATMDDPWENEYLFPGRALGQHLSEAAVSYYLKKHKLTAEQLFATAIHQAYLSGIRQPKALVRAFGISDVTAMKYLQMIDPRVRDEVERRVHG